MFKEEELTKYKIDYNDSITINNTTTVYRIVSLKNFNDIKKGQKGGFVESYRNLSNEGNCWIYDNAIVCDFAKICGDALILNQNIKK